MLVLALALAVFRTIYLDAVPAAVLPHDAAAVLYDTIVAVPAPGAAHDPGAGPGRRRRGVPHRPVDHRGADPPGPPRDRPAARRRRTAGLATGPVGTWVCANKQALRIAAVALAALALVFWGQPTGKTSSVSAGLLLVALALIEFLGQPPQPTAAPTTRT